MPRQRVNSTADRRRSASEMDSFELMSGLDGLAGIGGFCSPTHSPTPLSAAPYGTQPHSDLGDYHVPGDAGALNLEEVPSFDLSDFGDALAAGSEMKPVAEVEASLAAFLRTMDPSTAAEETLPDLPEPGSPGEASSPLSVAGDEEELPEGWDESMMDMTTPQLNKCIARRGLSKAQGKIIKACRRRLKNRCYAKISRKRRLQKQAVLADNHEQVASRSEALSLELLQTQRANLVLRRRAEALTALLVNSGTMSDQEIDAFVQEFDAETPTPP